MPPTASRPARPGRRSTAKAWVAGAAVGLGLSLVACGGGPEDATPGPGAVTVFEGGRIIVGDGRPPIDDGLLVVRNDRIVDVGSRETLAADESADVIPGIPANTVVTRIDVSGRTLMPTLIDLHSHLGYTDEASQTPSADFYTRRNLLEHLARYAYFGIGVTVSLGLDRGDLAYEIRDEAAPGLAHLLTAGRGIALPDAGPLAQHWRDAPYGITSAEEGRAAVSELAARAVDIVKIWVDDRGGTVPTLPREYYEAIIDEAHARGLRVIAHVYYLDDAKALLQAGVDGFAHGVRDREVDRELIDLMRARPGVFLVPNLPDRPVGREDLADLAAILPASTLVRLEEAGLPDRGALPTSFDVQARSLVRLAEAGVPIGLGTDAGTGRPIGWSAHQELADMVTAGLTPAQALEAATGGAAAILGLDDRGTLVPDARADFIVLQGNPLIDVRRTRGIEAVYFGGRAIDREGLARTWTSSGGA